LKEFLQGYEKAYLDPTLAQIAEQRKKEQQKAMEEAKKAQQRQKEIEAKKMADFKYQMQRLKEIQRLEANLTGGDYTYEDWKWYQYLRKDYEADYGPFDYGPVYPKYRGEDPHWEEEIP
jgi:hypothetical protein